MSFRERKVASADPLLVDRERGADKCLCSSAAAPKHPTGTSDKIEPSGHAKKPSPISLHQISRCGTTAGPRSLHTLQPCTTSFYNALHEPRILARPVLARQLMSPNGLRELQLYALSSYVFIVNMRSCILNKEVLFYGPTIFAAAKIVFDVRSTNSRARFKSPARTASVIPGKVNFSQSAGQCHVPT